MSEWISVKDRLPKLGKHVLAYSSFRKSYAEDWTVEAGNGPEWWGPSSWQPTHWMPLPDPPKEAA